MQGNKLNFLFTPPRHLLITASNFIHQSPQKDPLNISQFLNQKCNILILINPHLRLLNTETFCHASLT